MYWKVLFILLFLVSCTPTPVDEQLSVKDGTNAKLTINATPSTNLGVMAVGSTTAILVDISNTGALDATDLSISILGVGSMSFTGDEYPGINGTCSNVITSGESCTIEVFVYSNFAANLDENIIIQFKDGIDSSTEEVSITGFFGNPGALLPNLSSVNFGNVQVGTQQEQLLTVSNTGQLGIEEMTAFIMTNSGDPGDFGFTGGGYPGVNGTCSTQLAPGESCTVEVLTVPSYLELEHEGSVEFSYKNPSQYQGISISLNSYGADIKGYLTATVKDVGAAVYETALNNADDSTLPIITYELKNSGYLDTSLMNFKSSGNLPLVVSDNRCPVSLAPDAICEIDLMLKPQYSYPLPADFEFPLFLSEQPIVFEYNNSKDAQLQESNIILGTGSIIGEANLYAYPNSEVSEPFDIDIVPITKTSTWNSEEWRVIVGTGAETRTLLLKNGAVGKNTLMTNISMSLTPSDGGLTISCIESSNCPTSLNDGQSFELTLSYEPVTAEDRSSDPYVLTINYNDGVKDKTFNVEVPTVASSFPYLSISQNFFNDTTQHYEKSTTNLINESKGESITIKNEGLSGVNIAQLIDRPTGQTGEEFFSFDDSDCNRIISNNETCTLSYTFLKPGDPRAKPFVHEQYENSFTFSNGIADGEDGHQFFQITYHGDIKERGWYDHPETEVDFGEVLFSTDDQDPTLGEINRYNQNFYLPGSSVKGDYPISNLKFEISGVEASHFSVHTVQDSVLISGGTDPANTESSSIKRQLIIRYTAPNQTVDLGADGLSTATLKIFYHGSGQADTGTDYEPEVVVINLKAKPVIEPKYEITTIGERQPFLPQLYDPDELIQQLADIDDVSHTIVTVVNRGLSDSIGGTKAILKTFKGLDESDNDIIDDHYKIRAVDINDSCFTSINTINSQVIEFTMQPMSSCEFEIYDYAPNGFGELTEKLKLTYQKSSSEKFEFESFNGIAFLQSDLRFQPYTGATINFVKFADIDLGTSTQRDFTIIPNIQSRFQVPGEVVSINRIDDRSGIPECNVALNLPSSWGGYETVYKPNSFNLSSNSCNGVRIHPGEDVAPEETTYFDNYETSCPLTIDFSPQHIGKAEVACFAVNFKMNESASSPIGTNYVLMAGAGKVPKSIFNGWQGIYAEGETLDNEAKIKLTWNPMSVVDNLGTVSGYRVFRRTLQEGTFGDEFIYEGSNSDFYNSDTGFFEFVNDTTEDLPEESEISPLEVNKVFSYKIQAIITVPNEGEFVSDTLPVAGFNDNVASVLLPGPYHTLIHRWTANMQSCMKLLGKSYVDLSREKDYSCDYTGELNKNGKFDVEEHTIIERYETGKRLGDGQPDFAPNLAPYLFESISQAKDYCASSEYTISDLNIYNESKELIGRIDYMIASTGIDKTTCVDSGNQQFSGGNRCQSIFGVQDLVGNAWDLIDDSLSPVNSTTWVYDEGSAYSGQQYYFPVSELDLDSYIGNDYNTFMDFFKFDSNVECFNSLFNEARYSLGGICADAKGEILMDDAYSDIINGVSSADTTVIFPKYESELGSAFTVKRFLMMGGSSSSSTRFDVSPHNRVMYWSNPETESILMAQHPNGQYEGAAPRCVFKFSFE